MDLEFWEVLVDSANGSQAFTVKSWHLDACFATLEIAGEPLWLELHRGRAQLHRKPPPQGPSFVIAGDRQAWDAVLSGQVRFPHAISGYGALALSGSSLELTWALPALNEVVRIAADRSAEGQARG